MVYPNPNPISVQDIILATLSGCNSIRIPSTDPKAAASAMPFNVLGKAGVVSGIIQLLCKWN